jgi:HEAT repeat protein
MSAFTLSMSLIPIVPSLQAAALRMTGDGFNSLTEHVRDHLLAGDHAKLGQLLAGQGIEPSRKVLGQIALARAFYFDEAIPAKMLSAIAEAPTAGQARAEMRMLQNRDALQSPDPIQRRSAAEALGRFKDPRAVEPLIKTLDDVDSRVRESAARSLGDLGDPRALKPLIKTLDDVDKWVRIAAASSLGELHDPRALEPLIKTLDDVDKWVRIVAASSLGELGDPRAVEPLIKALSDVDEGVRSNAAWALDQIRDAQCRKGA